MIAGIFNTFMGDVPIIREHPSLSCFDMGKISPKSRAYVLKLVERGHDAKRIHGARHNGSRNKPKKAFWGLFWASSYGMPQNFLSI
uniref:Uncharacterized protein n=1 Tax=Romanomermis culicivorax TaxID=13658 RepID=A0A915HLA9_ROMCU